MRDEAFGDVPQEAKIQVTKWQGVSFAVGASCENNDADLHPVSRTRVQQQRRVARTLFGHRRRSPTIQLGAGPRRRMGNCRAVGEAFAAGVEKCRGVAQAAMFVQYWNPATATAKTAPPARLGPRGV